MAVSLNFKPDHVFLWGSPLAAFVSIAGEDHEAIRFSLPQGSHLYNIFHPQDPVAFRLEPLYYQGGEQVPPETVAYWANNAVRPSKQWARSYEYAKGLAHQKWTSFKSTLWEAVGTADQADVMRTEWETYLNDKRQEWAEEALEAGPKARIDYVLQELAMETYVESYGLLQSHFCYWNSHDVALLMLKKISQQGTAEIHAVERDQRDATEKAQVAKQEVEVAQQTEAAAAAAAAPPEGALALFHQSFGMPSANALVQRLSDVPCLGRCGEDDDGW